MLLTQAHLPYTQTAIHRIQSVIKGKGTMPPKGGNPSLSEEDIKATVEYMISQAK